MEQIAINFRLERFMVTLDKHLLVFGFDQELDVFFMMSFATPENALLDTLAKELIFLTDQ